MYLLLQIYIYTITSWFLKRKIDNQQITIDYASLDKSYDRWKQGKYHRRSIKDLRQFKLSHNEEEEEEEYIFFQFFACNVTNLYVSLKKKKKKPRPVTARFIKRKQQKSRRWPSTVSYISRARWRQGNSRRLLIKDHKRVEQEGSEE